MCAWRLAPGWDLWLGTTVPGSDGYSMPPTLRDLEFRRNLVAVSLDIRLG